MVQETKEEQKLRESSLNTVEDTLAIEDSIEENFCDKENRIQLFKKLQKLDEDTRNVMYLRIFGNFEYDEIAEIMSKTSNWARVVFFRGKQKLKEDFDK